MPRVLSENGRKKSAVCNTCTMRLVEVAHERRPSFRILREPFRFGMLLFSVIYRINPEEYEVRTPQCRGCMRFRKLALKERSPMFRRLNSFFNPIFDRHLESIVTEMELKEAKEYARQAIAGEAPELEKDG